ncbi:tryptophan synthase subunit alpha [Actinokineospora sp. HUAS TT18]|uniref:tryptophan synthase subunit alpha n=1 Tax=Actinokineospora sp. HUAS TT18 TaxID=3447451 RepID=UPI003F527D56
MPDRAFFPGRGPADIGLALFLNAGDPPLSVLPDLLQMLDESEVDCLELAVPFPNSITDGPVIRQSADRALAEGTDLDAVLKCLDSVRLRHTRIALLADWSHTVRPLGLQEFVATVRDAAVDGLLVHGLPPLRRAAYREATAEAGVQVVATCYPRSASAVLTESAATASAYLYLVAHYGRTGSAPAAGFTHLGAVIDDLRDRTDAPIAVGFGVRGPAEVAALAAAGADAAVVGSAAVAVVERALAERRDAVEDLAGFVATLKSTTTQRS